MYGSDLCKSLNHGNLICKLYLAVKSIIIGCHRRYCGNIGGQAWNIWAHGDGPSHIGQAPMISFYASERLNKCNYHDGILSILYHIFWPENSKVSVAPPC